MALAGVPFFWRRRFFRSTIAKLLAGGGGGAPPTNAPVLTKTSGAGVSPFTFDEAIPSNIYAGYRRRVQTASDAGFTTIVQDLFTPVTEAELAGDQCNWSDTNGLNPPRQTADNVIVALNLAWGGTRYLRMRYECDIDATTTVTYPWSNVISDTFGTVALSTTNKHANITLSGTPKLGFSSASFDGSHQMVAADTAKSGGKRMWSYTVTSHSASAQLAFGVFDGTDNFVATTSPRPGIDDAHGVYFVAWSAGFELRNNTNTLVASGYGGAADGFADGDEYTVIQDDTANTITVWRTRAGVDRNMASASFTGQKTPFGGGDQNGITGSFNFGGSAFALASANQGGAVSYQS